MRNNSQIKIAELLKMGDFQLLGVLNVEGEGASGNEFLQIQTSGKFKKSCQVHGCLRLHRPQSVCVSKHFIFLLSQLCHSLNMHVN